MPDELTTAQQDVTFDPFSPSVKDPVFKVANPDGTKREYDPFDIAKKLEALDLARKGKDTSLSMQIDDIRSIFGYPTTADIESAIAAGQSAPLTPSPNQTLALLQKFMEVFEGLEVIKKLQGLTPSLSGAASNPQK